MKSDLNLSECSLQEKLEMVDAIWDDIRHQPGSLSSPAWHEKILQERKQRVEDGTEKILDWEEAKVVLDQEIGS